MSRETLTPAGWWPERSCDYEWHPLPLADLAPTLTPVGTAVPDLIATLRMIRPILAFEAGRNARKQDGGQIGIGAWERLHAAVVAVIDKATDG